jgi:hypothetical protein
MMLGLMGKVDNEKFVHDWVAEWASEPPVFGWATDLLFDEIRNAPEAAWDLILKLIGSAPDDGPLGWVAAGPLEDLLCQWGPTFIDRVEALARSDDRFRRSLTGVWGWSRMDPDVYSRMRRAVDNT